MPDLKPPYRLTTMAELRRLEPNGLKVVSLFSGCGGSTLGWRQAGFEVPYACEFVESARLSYAANFPDAHLDPRDVREVQPGEILERLELAAGELDVLDGSPPCTSFSMAGARERLWGKVVHYPDQDQRHDDLFLEFARLLAGLRPRAFVAENVAGLVRGVSKGHFLRFLAELEGCGYRVAVKLLDAAWLGVPQSRHRLIFVGVRDDLGLEPVHPAPLPWRYVVTDALPYLERWHFSSAGNRAAKDHDVRAPAPTITVGGSSSEAYNHYVSDRRDGPEVPLCVERGARAASARWPPGLRPRKLTIDEVKALCGFPADFALAGTYAKQWERLGNAVPPPMMRAVAERLRDAVLAPVTV